MGVPFSWNQRSPSEPLSSRTLMMLLLMQRLSGCLIVLQVWLLVAWYFTLATMTMTLPSDYGGSAESSSIWKNSLVSTFVSRTWAFFLFDVRFISVGEGTSLEIILLLKSDFLLFAVRLSWIWLLQAPVFIKFEVTFKIELSVALLGQGVAFLSSCELLVSFSFLQLCPHVLLDSPLQEKLESSLSLL